MKNTKTIVAIDPGKSGGVAVVHYDNSHILSSVLYNCPDSTKDMANIIRSVENSCIIDDKKLSIVIEHVWSFPTDARSSAFKFGTNYGMWLGIIGAFRFECEKISPQKWMKKSRTNCLWRSPRYWLTYSSLRNTKQVKPSGLNHWRVICQSHLICVINFRYLIS